MKQSRIALLVLLVLALLVALVSCTDDAGSGTTDTGNTGGTTDTGNTGGGTHTHTYAVAWTSDADYHWHAATCGHADEVKDKAAHTYENGTCTVCGRAEPGLEYELTEAEDGYCVTGVGTCADTCIIIPATYNGFPVVSIGDWAFYGCQSLTSITIPSSVASIGEGAFGACMSLTSITIPDGVTSIGYSAFKDCTSLTSITIPSSVTSIGDYVFSGCTNIETATIPTVVIGAIPKDSLKTVTINGGTSIGDDAFYGCTGLTSVTIPSSVTSIGDSAFSGCTGLTSIAIPEGVTSIGDFAFKGCYKLVEVYNLSELNFTEGSPDYGEIARYAKVVYNSKDSVSKLKTDANGYLFYENGDEVYLIGYTGTQTELTLPEKSPSGKAYNINQYAFYYCTNLTSITIPSSVTSIGNDAFSGCTSIETATIPTIAIATIPKDSLKTVIINGGTGIGDSAFSGCTSLTSITIPEGVTSIGDDAFSNCRSLTSITIPSSVTIIGKGVFSGCESLMSITVADGNTVYHSAGNCLIETATKTLVAGCKNSVIPTDGSVTSIGGSAFWGCTDLTSITIPSSVASIGEGAFGGCMSLTSITIPDGVTSISRNAFYNCTSLTGVYITDLAAWCGISFADYDSNPLYYAHNLYLNGTLVTDLVIREGVTGIGRYAFRDCTSLTSVTISEGVTSIGGYAFYGCTSLTSVTISEGVTSIGSGAFEDCTGLTGVYITDLAAWCGISFADYDNDSNPLYYAHNLYLNGTLVTDLVIPEGVTSIGKRAFSGCTNLTSITIPSSVTSIGDSAFVCCYKLVEVYNLSKLNIRAGSENYGYVAYYAKVVHTSKDSVSKLKTDANGYQFYEGDDEIYLIGYTGTQTELTLPEKSPSGKAYNINQYAFRYCASLTSITIPSSVTSIGKGSFGGCAGLTSVTFAENSQLTGIGRGAFEDCTSLTSITIPSSVTSIGDRAFCDCYSLMSITIPSSVTSIDYKAFYGCMSLTSITIPSSVTSIGDEAFVGCFKLVEVYNLSKLNIRAGSLDHGEVAYYAKAVYTSKASVSKLKTDADGYLFYEDGDDVYLIGYTGTQTDLILPEKSPSGKVYNIYQDAFMYCTKLTSITIPSSVTSIGRCAFIYCTNLTNITIPSSVTSIGKGSFWGCTVLTSITYSGTKEQWNHIKMGSDWAYDTSSFVVHCTDGDIIAKSDV